MKRLLLFVGISLLLLAAACSRQEAGGGPPLSLPTNAVNDLFSPWERLLPAFPPPAGVAPPGGVVVEVNGRRLTVEALEAQAAAIINKSGTPSQPSEQKARLKERLVNDFIARTLLEEEITRQNITVSSRVIDNQVSKFEKGLPAGTSLKSFLEERGVNLTDFRQEIALGVKTALLVERQRPIKVTPAEIQYFYNKNRGKMVIPPVVRVRHILVAAAPTETKEQRRAKHDIANNILQRLREGGDFTALATSFSNCPSRKRGGDLGYLTREMIVDKGFAQAAFDGKIGIIERVVETPAGFHVLEVLEKRPAQTRPLDDNLRREIGAFISQQKHRENFHELMKTLKNKAELKIYR